LKLNPRLTFPRAWVCGRFLHCSFSPFSLLVAPFLQAPYGLTIFRRRVFLPLPTHAPSPRSPGIMAHTSYPRHVALYIQLFAKKPPPFTRTGSPFFIFKLVWRFFSFDYGLSPFCFVFRFCAFPSTPYSLGGRGRSDLNSFSFVNFKRRFLYVILLLPRSPIISFDMKDGPCKSFPLKGTFFCSSRAKLLL